MIGPVLRAMRPRQWSKNVFVLAPLVFAQKIGDPTAMATTGAAFGAFCLMASGVYLVNDALDVEEDQKHPQKKHRPIAAGELAVSTAIAIAVTLFAVAIATALWVGVPFLLMLVLYLMMNLAYSSGLKHVVILDVMMVASGFVIRAIAGSVALAVPISDWLFLCTTMVALFLAHYNVAFLDQMISVTTSSTVLTYALYTLSPEVSSRIGTHNLKWTVPFVLFGIFRYLYLVHVRKVPGDPTATLFADVPSVVNVIAYACVVFAVLY
jgi:4-hydroxybenzoate polyprenyltransferase